MNEYSNSLFIHYLYAPFGYWTEVVSFDIQYWFELAILHAIAMENAKTLFSRSVPNCLY